ncbi:MAG TPA: oligosaccharide flippase family protein [Acidimicrobiales bacterium]|nr:oligosaccharide flippase family protein [Acidimicrobiales bacterium]
MTSLVAGTTSATPAGDPRPGGVRPLTPGPEDGRGRSTLRVLVGGTAWNALAQFVPVPVNVVMTPYLIHHLGIDRWGLIALVTTVASIVSSFDGGLTGALNRYYAIYAGADDRSATTTTLTTVLVFVFGAGLVLGLSGWFLAPRLVDLFAMPRQLRPETTFYMQLVVGLLALTFARNAIAGVIIARQRYGLNSALSVSTYVVWIVGLILTVQGGWGLRGVGVTFLAQQFVATVIVVPPALRYLDRRSVRLLPRGEIRKFFSYSAKIQVTGVSNLANAEFDNLVIGTLLSVHAVALYNAGTGFAVQVTGVLRNALTPAGTFLARTFGGRGQPAAWDTFVRLQRVWAVACSGFYAAALGAAYFAIVDWLGPGFRVGGVIAMIVIAGQAVLSMAMMLGYYCMILGFAGIEVRVGLINVAVNVALTAALVFVGVLGVVVATALAWLASSWWLLHDSRRRISGSIPDFIDVVSLPASLTTALCVFGMEYGLHGALPEGALGLIGASGPALVGLGIFVVIRFGPRRVGTMIGEVLAARPQGLGAMARHLVTAMIDAVGGPGTGAEHGVLSA